jgi:hypothetical protein
MVSSLSLKTAKTKQQSYDGPLEIIRQNSKRKNKRTYWFWRFVLECFVCNLFVYLDAVLPIPAVGFECRITAHVCITSDHIESKLLQLQ